MKLQDKLKVYEVIKNFDYFEIIIKKGEILNTYLEANNKIHQGLWWGFIRASDHRPVQIKQGFFKALFFPQFRSVSNYNAQYIPEDCVKDISAYKCEDIK